MSAARRIALGIVAVAFGAFLLMRSTELTPTPTPPASSPPAHSPVTSTATGARSPSGASGEPGTVAARAPATPRVVVSARWGDGKFELGHRRDPESAGEGPHALAVDHAGRILVVDQLHGRIVRFSPDGKPLDTIKLPSATVDDLAITGKGQLAMLDRLAEKSAWLTDDKGKLIGEAPIEGRGVAEAGGTTGLFVDDNGDVYVEYAHTGLVQVATADGKVGSRVAIPGRPRKDGVGVYLRGAIVDRAAGIVRLDALSRDANVQWTVNLPLGAPILYIELVDSDLRGVSYVAAHVGHEATTPPYAVTDDTLVMVAIDAAGTPCGSVRLPSSPSPDESFRELTIGDDGTIYRMVKTDAGVEIQTFVIAP